MPSLDRFFSSDFVQSPWVLAPAAFALWMLVLVGAKTLLLGAMRRFVMRSAWNWDDLLVRALSLPLLIAIAASGLVVFDRILPLSPEWDRAFDVLLAGAIVLALVLFVDRACRGILERFAARTRILQGAQGLIQGSVRGVIIGLGLLVFLDSIGISITPILASLGVGSLAVALALQDTLANFFAGIHMVVDKPIEPGHFVQLPSGEEGTVSKIGWRSTWIRTSANNVVVIPNSKLAGSVITNYSLPDTQVEVQVDAAADYGSDLERTEKVTLEVAREVMGTVAGGVPGFEPIVRYQTFGESGVQFSVVLRARDFSARNPVRHEFVKRLQVRYLREGISIPFPIRSLDLPSGRLEGLRGILGGSFPDPKSGGTKPGPEKG
jgi:small-conductance mechanosensitive channel